jgi:ribosomal protein S18 acetylase RimI-like enzyme
MDIREATINDYDDLSKIFLAEDMYHYEKDNIENKLPVLATRSKERIQTELDSTDRTIFVAIEDDKPVGLVWVALKTRENNPMLTDKVYGFINDIGVLKEYRGKGIGKALLIQAIDWIKEQDITAKSVELLVDDFNIPAKELYKSLGFKDQYHCLELKL